jgi:hypothetical protein
VKGIKLILDHLVLSLVVILMLSVLSPNSMAAKGSRGTQERVVGVLYFKMMFGHLHSRPSPYSESLTTIACGQPMRIFSSKGKKRETLGGGGWVKAKAGSRQGYIPQHHLQAKKPTCFQDRYPAFFKTFKLDLSELYYWGRLHDQYISGKSQVF